MGISIVVTFLIRPYFPRFSAIVPKRPGGVHSVQDRLGLNGIVDDHIGRAPAFVELGRYRFLLGN